MSDSTKQEANASPDPYARGFQTGCLMGCAPLILLGVGIVLLMACGGLFYEPSFDEVTPAVNELPEIAKTAAEKDLLPKAPPVKKSPVYVGDDLSRVPLLALETIEKAPAEDWKKRRAHAVAAALHLNEKEQDGYLKAVLRRRPDLAGLPFAMGKDCRTIGDEAVAFKEAANAVRSTHGAALVAETDQDAETIHDREVQYRARMAVAMQVIPAESATNRKSLVRGLASIPRPEATRRLARLAVYSPDKGVRSAALEALLVRRGEGATKVLAAGLKYPWPAVAENAATAIVRLDRKDLIPQLEAMLDAPDPRAPKQETVEGREETVAYELVRFNHLQNCLLCHAPVRRGFATDSLSAEIPVPSTAVPSAYYQPESNLLVRIDVTYLRQDFSTLLAVADWTAESWTPRQRFDFLLRRRVLSPAEAADLRERLAGVSPYQRAAVRALRSLTGRDVGLKAIE